MTGGGRLTCEVKKHHAVNLYYDDISPSRNYTPTSLLAIMYSQIIAASQQLGEVLGKNFGETRLKKVPRKIGPPY
jgi:hypothetical protein